MKTKIHLAVLKQPNEPSRVVRFQSPTITGIPLLSLGNFGPVQVPHAILPSRKHALWVKLSISDGRWQDDDTWKPYPWNICYPGDSKYPSHPIKGPVLVTLRNSHNATVSMSPDLAAQVAKALDLWTYQGPTTLT